MRRGVTEGMGLREEVCLLVFSFAGCLERVEYWYWDTFALS
jgi:uncharacterized membrane protein YhaH (DUF805 family)